MQPKSEGRDADSRARGRAGAGQGPAYAVLLGLSALFALGAVLTLIPRGGAPWPNMLGYKGLCSFAPASTLACALLAAITCAIRARFVKRAPAPAAATIIVLLILAAAFAWSTAAWAAEKAKYVDGTSSATAAAR
jgi:hypothetical protein